MAKYPIFLEMSGRKAVVVGGGAVALKKGQALLEAGARILMVAEKASELVTLFCQDNHVELIKSKYSKDYLSDSALVIAATNNKQVNGQVYKDCQELEILCNVVDDPELCDFFVPAVVRRKDLKIAIGTEGNCPAYAGHIRKKLEEFFTEEHGDFLCELEMVRDQIKDEVADQAERKAILGKLASDESFEYYKQKGSASWRERALEVIGTAKV